MRIAVISDLHLGAGDASDSFGHRDGEFLRFLRFLEDNFERIVLLGDIWETLTPRRFGAYDESLREAREAHPLLAERFERPRYTYVHGNHDMIAGASLGARDALRIDADGTRLLFTHGHHHDFLIRHAFWLPKLGVWLGAWLRRMGLSAAYRLFDGLDRWRAGTHLDPGSCSFQRWAIDLARDEGADVIVTGHTHIATRAEHGSRLFLNSGSCSEGRFTFSSIDTRAGTYATQCSW